MTERTDRRDDESPAEYRERLERYEIEAATWFDYATQPQRAVHRVAVNDLKGLFGPRYERAREAASAAWKSSTAHAAALYELTLNDLMATGEVSEAVQFQWEELKVAEAMAEQPAAPLLQAAE